jgi:hypothetical protein
MPVGINLESCYKCEKKGRPKYIIYDIDSTSAFVECVECDNFVRAGNEGAAVRKWNALNKKMKIKRCKLKK